MYKINIKYRLWRPEDEFVIKEFASTENLLSASQIVRGLVNTQRKSDFRYVGHDPVSFIITDKIGEELFKEVEILND